MAVISIDYNEGGKEGNWGYKGVVLNSGATLRKKEVFNSGDFVKDWFSCIKFIIINDIKGDNGFISHSSSVNHWISDTKTYDSAYLQVKKGKTMLLYGFNKETRDLPEVFVKAGTKPTWEELKAICK
jgi:hypothetical protein